MPIGMISPMTIVARLITPIAIADPAKRPAEAGVEPLPLAPRGLAHRAAALVERAHHAVGARDDRSKRSVGRHLPSIGVNGEAAFSSLPWATPSARAI